MRSEELSPKERLVLAERDVRAAHQRMDKFERDVKNTLEDIQGDLKLLLEQHHRRAGSTATIVAICTLLGGAIGWFAEHLFSKL